MKNQQYYNISNTSIESLIKFFQHLLLYFKIDEADRLPTSMYPLDCKPMQANLLMFLYLFSSDLLF